MTQPWRGTSMALSSTWRGELREAEVGLGTTSTPSWEPGHRGCSGCPGRGSVVAGTAGTVPGAEAGSHPGRKVRGVHGASTTLGTPNPLPSAQHRAGCPPQVPSVRGTPTLPYSAACLGGLATVGARTGGPGAAGELAPVPMAAPRSSCAER